MNSPLPRHCRTCNAQPVPSGQGQVASTEFVHCPVKGRGRSNLDYPAQFLLGYGSSARQHSFPAVRPQNAEGLSRRGGGSPPPLAAALHRLPAEFPAASLGKTQLPVGTVSVCLPLYLASQSATSYDGLSSVMPVNHGVPENVKKSASVKLTEAPRCAKNSICTAVILQWRISAFKVSQQRSHKHDYRKHN